MSEQRANDLLSSGAAAEGVLRVAATNYRVSFISGGGINGKDICVPTFEMRNRALDGDTVVVEKHPRAMWTIMEKDALRKGVCLWCVCVRECVCVCVCVCVSLSDFVM